MPSRFWSLPTSSVSGCARVTVPSLRKKVIKGHGDVGGLFLRKFARSHTHVRSNQTSALLKHLNCNALKQMLRGCGLWTCVIQAGGAILTPSSQAFQKKSRGRRHLQWLDKHNEITEKHIER